MNPLKELTDELGQSLVTEDGQLILADGHEVSTAIPAMPRRLVYHRDTGILEWEGDEVATEYRVWSSAGAGYPIGVIMTVASEWANVGVLGEGEHRVFRVSGVNSYVSKEGPPSHTIHAAGAGRKL